MDVRNVSVIIVGIIWFLVGAGLGIAGIRWLLELGIGIQMIIYTSLATIIGLVKGKFVLRKVALKYYNRSKELQYTRSDIFLGWMKILGIKGAVLIVIMMVLGALLRHSTIDRPILGIVYLALGIALLYASKVFFIDKDKVLS